MKYFLRLFSVLLVFACFVPNYAYSFDEFDYGEFDICNGPYPSEEELCDIAVEMEEGSVSLANCERYCTDACETQIGYEAEPNAVAGCKSPCWVRCSDICVTNNGCFTTTGGIGCEMGRGPAGYGCAGDEPGGDEPGEEEDPCEAGCADGQYMNMNTCTCNTCPSAETFYNDVSREYVASVQNNSITSDGATAQAITACYAKGTPQKYYDLVGRFYFTDDCHYSNN